jgi:pSer/pThr/pTyr-binding forkhead associated (FHA) protein
MEKRLADSTLVFKRPVTPILEVILSDGTKSVRTISTECVIVGRSKQADVSVDDDKLSRNHFMVVRSDGKFEIKDLGSSNGLVINGKKTKHAVLTGNDSIKAGATLFHFVLCRDDLRKDEMLISDPSFSVNMFEKKYSPKKGLFGKKALLTALSASLLVFAVTLGVLGLEKEARVAPSIKKDKTLQSIINVEKEIDASRLSAEDRLKALNYFRIAEHHFNLKNWDLAKKTMETYYSLVPNSALAPAFIAVCDEIMSKVATVDDKIDEIQKDTEKRELIAKLLKQGTYELDKGNFDDANGIFLKVINLDEYNQEAYDGLIAIDKELARIQKDKEGQQLVEPVAAGIAYAKQMEEFFKKGNYTKSFEIAVRIATMGKTKAGEGPFAKAINTQMKIKTITNKMFAHTVSEAGLLARANAGDEAIKLYKKVLAMFPYHDGAKAGLAAIMKQRHEQAKFLYATALVERSYPQESKAAEKLRTILTLVPSSDEYYQKARVALQKKS